MVHNVLRLLIADDHESVRYSLRLIMSTYDDIDVIGEAANGQEAVDLCERLQPDLVLMDLSMPIMDGVTATRLIRQRFPHIRVLILTSGIDPDMITAAMGAGAQGYLEKRVDFEVLTKAMWSAMTGSIRSSIWSFKDRVFQRGQSIGCLYTPTCLYQAAPTNQKSTIEANHLYSTLPV
jgi:DNA-binding NarL/FixJ family response regulator